MEWTQEQLDFIRSVNCRSGSYITRNKPKGEDLTLNGYIEKHGGIYSQLDGKTYTTKSGYEQHLKDNDCHIKDY